MCDFEKSRNVACRTMQHCAINGCPADGSRVA
jgi:hypothetical protein